MSERTAPPLGRPRVNPFAFPSETTLRFVLLVIFVVCGSARLYGEFRGHEDPAANQCVTEFWSALSKLNTSAPADIGRDAGIFGREGLRLFAQCTALLRPVVVWQLGGICAVILVAALFYFFASLRSAPVGMTAICSMSVAFSAYDPSGLPSPTAPTV